MIEVKDLTFSYDEKPFIEKMNFSVKSGEIFGFLGPRAQERPPVQKIMTGLITNYQEASG